MLLEGLHLPLTTPFLPDGGLNLRKLEANVARYTKTPATGLAVLSRTGQPLLLSEDETRSVLQVAAQAATAEKVLWAGIARASVAGALDLIDFAASARYDVALLPVPSILCEPGAGVHREKEILTFVKTIADRSALTVVLDDAPAADGVISLEMVAELAGHPNILGMTVLASGARHMEDLIRVTAFVRREVTVTTVFAAATGRMLTLSQPQSDGLILATSLSAGGAAIATAPAITLKTRKKTVGFQILACATGSVLDALQAGAVGGIPPLAASVPQACYEVLAAWKDGDPALAAEKQERLTLLARRVEEGLGVPGIKFGCDLNGYFGGRPRLPSLPLTGLERAEVEKLMQGIRN